MQACGRDEGPAGESANALLAHVPAGTPYVAANLEPIPTEVIDTFLQRAQPVLDSMQQELASTRERIQAEPMSADPGSRLLLALLQEFDGKLSRQGLESLGFDLQAMHVLYGVGAFPTVRFGLSDASALRATVDRVLSAAGIAAPRLEFQGKSYWRVVPGDPDEQIVGAYIAILDDHLAAAVLPTAEESVLLPQFLGTVPVAASDAAERLQAVNARHGYTPYGTGVVDLQKLADEMMNAESLTARTFAGHEDNPISTFDEVCKQEIRSMIAHAPTMVMGTTEMTPNAIGYQYVAETEPSLATRLIGLIAEVPMVGRDSERLAEMSFALKFGPVRDFLRANAEAIVMKPYECEHLHELNQQAREAFDQLNQPMPPFLNNFNGLRLAVNNLDTSSLYSGDSRGLIAVHVTQPEMFVGMAQMFLPDLASLTLTPGSEPVQIPQNLLPLPDIVAFAALSDDAIGVSIGAGEEQGLLPWLKEEGGPGNTFLSFNYDTARYLAVSSDMQESWESEHDPAEDLEGEKQFHESMRAVGRAFNDAYANFAGRSYVSMSFTEAGFVIDSHMTFK